MDKLPYWAKHLKLHFKSCAQTRDLKLDRAILQQWYLSRNSQLWPQRPSKQMIYGMSNRTQTHLPQPRDTCTHSPEGPWGGVGGSGHTTHVKCQPWCTGKHHHYVIKEPCLYQVTTCSSFPWMVPVWKAKCFFPPAQWFFLLLKLNELCAHQSVNLPCSTRENSWRHAEIETSLLCCSIRYWPWGRLSTATFQTWPWPELRAEQQSFLLEGKTCSSHPTPNGTHSSTP